jgi:lipooligosaccharide transport system ATP-binding protein
MQIQDPFTSNTSNISNPILPEPMSQPDPDGSDASPLMPVLVAHDLWKSYGDRPVVEGIQFAINPGEVLGLLGPNGAGKTTTVGMLYGAVKPDRGFVQVGTAEVERNGRQAREHMGIVTQDDNLDLDFTVMDNLIHFAHHYRMVGREAKVRAGEVLALVNLENYAKRSPKELSGGMKRRLVLARALLNSPSVVFLDEPTTGLDPEARQDLWKIVLALKQEGCGVLLTTHYMDEAQRLCDRLLLLQKGKVINEGPPDQLILDIVGHEVVEIEGVSVETMEFFLDHADIWCRPFGNGFLLALPAQPEATWNLLTAMRPRRLTRRLANLEDVFLRLTGKSLA